MKINVEKSMFAKPDGYNEKGLVRCKCGKHYYPSKKMFADFLGQFKGIAGVADIWSRNDWNTGKTTITVEVVYSIRHGENDKEEPWDSSGGVAKIPGKVK